MFGKSLSLKYRLSTDMSLLQGMFNAGGVPNVTVHLPSVNYVPDTSTGIW